MESVHGVDVSWMSKHTSHNNAKGTVADRSDPVDGLCCVTPDLRNQKTDNELRRCQLKTTYESE